MKKFAALDLGSNTFLCLLGEGEGGNILKVHKDLVELVRLGEGLSKNKKFSEPALLRARQALEAFNKEIEVYGPDSILAMATAAARDAENKLDLEKICMDLKIPLRIISGGEEARLTYQGALSGVGQNSSAENINKRYIVIDIGGRSTELCLGRGARFEKGKSIFLGAVELTEEHSLQASRSSRDLVRAREDIQVRLRKGFGDDENFIGEEPPSEVIAVAGTPTALAQMFVGFFDADRIDGLRINRSDLEKKIEEILDQGPENISRKYNIPPRRSDVLLAGALILYEIMVFLCAKELKVSTKGIRYGIAMDISR